MTEGVVKEAISGSDRKIMMMIVRDIIENLKKAGAKKPSNQIGRGVLSILRAMTYTPDNANYKNYKKYFPKTFNSKLVQKRVAQFHTQNDKVQLTMVKQAMNKVLGEGTLREQIREAIRENLNEQKETNFQMNTKDMREVDKLLKKGKFKGLKMKSKGPKFILTVPKKMEDKVLSYLIQKNVKNINEV
tara:strand:+ start:210 stop:773 length:564 start_codon:yes stop_codon:yes gene_type:complete